ncbi:MAG: hypothetical protein V1744_06940 [Candidatus Altiarchaeota archaeon]
MVKRLNLWMIPVLILVLGVFFSKTASAEIIIVNETKQSFYAVEDMVLKGDLDVNKLMISGSGQVISGENVRVYLLGRPSDILIDNLKVNGRGVPVSFDDKGYFMVLNVGEFVFQGDLTLRTMGQVRLHVPGPVNELKFDLKHGYAIHGDQYGLFGDEVIIQRSEKVAMLVDGAFKYTFAERNQFNYLLDYRSFGSSLGQAVVNLRNGEAVASVAGAKDYSISGSKLMLELEGDTAHVTVSGTFDGGVIIVPLDEGRHNVLIESDPQKRITISTDAEEIDLTQSPMSPSYSNARAFLASKDNVFTVSVRDLQMFPSLAASVSRATNRIAITEKGSMLGELSYQYSNTGVDYIQIDAPGTPLYAGTGYRNSVKLTKDDGKLFLSFPKTQSGTLDMIYFDTRAPLKPIDYIDVPVANTDLPITEAETQIILPKDYVVLWTFGPDMGGSELPSLESLMVFLVVFGWIGYMLKPRIGYSILYIIYSAGLLVFSSMLLALSVIVSIALIIKRHVAANSMKMMLAGAAILVVLCIAVVLLFGVVGMFGTYNMGGAPERGGVTIASDWAQVEEAAPTMKSMNVLGSGDGALNVPVREGVLPVRMEIPNLGKTVSVTSHLVNKDTNPLKVSVLVAAGWLKYILYVISLAAFMQCVKKAKS